MAELEKARAELACHEQQEQCLLQQLTDIRKAADYQRSRIDVLVRGRLAPIKGLPIEVLQVILAYAIHAAPSDCDVHLHRKWELAMVSRRWRDAILYHPPFWTHIKLTPAWDLAIVKAHVARSGACLLDIQLQSWTSNQRRETLPALLDAVASSVHRWRSFVIHNGVGYPITAQVLEYVGKLTLPSLTRVSIPLYPSTIRDIEEGTVHYPSFLKPGTCSSMKELELRNFVPDDDFCIPEGLISLVLRLPDYRPSGSTAFLASLTSQTLKTLTLTGNIDHWGIPPDTIHFPLLEKLEVRVSNLKGLLEALVVPRLQSFQYRPYRPQDPPSVVFGDLYMKFSPVKHLAFSLWETIADRYEDANTFCTAFPGVHHAEMEPSDLQYLFQYNHGSCAADHWVHLESLTVNGINNDILRTPNELSLWLDHRKRMGKSKIRVKISKIQGSDWDYGVCWLSALYESLHERCILEFDNVPLVPSVLLSGEVDSALELVRIRFERIRLQVDVKCRRLYHACHMA
ncbi:hypothetical protein ID866_8701 [Astraeus odoratus]|nr:hypothetical protein ID866_8701 [Astraeus odoratus]